MNVVEMEAGDGYYTELLSRVVGQEGTIYMQNPPSFANFLGDSVSVITSYSIHYTKLYEA